MSTGLTRSGQSTTKCLLLWWILCRWVFTSCSCTTSSLISSQLPYKFCLFANVSQNPGIVFRYVGVNSRYVAISASSAEGSNSVKHVSHHSRTPSITNTGGPQISTRTKHLVCNSQPADYGVIQIHYPAIYLRCQSHIGTSEYSVTIDSWPLKKIQSFTNKKKHWCIACIAMW